MARSPPNGLKLLSYTCHTSFEALILVALALDFRLKPFIIAVFAGNLICNGFYHLGTSLLLWVGVGTSMIAMVPGWFLLSI